VATGVPQGRSASRTLDAQGRAFRELRKWYSHDPARFDDFAARYASELETEEGAAALNELRDVLRAGPVTLVTAARDLDGSHAAVLARLLSQHA